MFGWFNKKEVKKVEEPRKEMKRDVIYTLTKDLYHLPGGTGLKSGTKFIFHGMVYHGECQEVFEMLDIGDLHQTGMLFKLLIEYLEESGNYTKK